MAAAGQIGLPATAMVARYDYNPADRPTSVLEADGSTNNWTYDPIYQLGSQDRVESALALSSLTTYQWDNLTTSQWATLLLDPGFAIASTYDSCGNLAVNTFGYTSTLTYDGSNRLQQATSDAGTVTSFQYDAAGNRSIVNAVTGLVTYLWDDLRRLIGVQTTGGLHTLTYNGDGLLYQKQSPSGTTRMVWGALSELMHELDGSNTLQRAYSHLAQEFGNLISHRDTGISTSLCYLQKSPRIAIRGLSRKNVGILKLIVITTESPR